MWCICKGSGYPNNRYSLSTNRFSESFLATIWLVCLFSCNFLIELNYFLILPLLNGSRLNLINNLMLEIKYFPILTLKFSKPLIVSMWSSKEVCQSTPDQENSKHTSQRTSATLEDRKKEPGLEMSSLNLVITQLFVTLQ